MAIHKDLTGAEAIHEIMYVQSGDPGAVGAGKFWLDTTGGATLTAGGILKQRDGTDTGWTTRADVKTALDLKANLASPALTGTPTAPTQSPGDDSTAIATTEYVEAAVAGVSGGATIIYDSGALGSPAASIDTGAAGIAGGYNVIEVWALLRTDQAVAASTIDVRVNNDSSAVYSYQRLTGGNATASANVVAGATSWQISAVGASMASGVFHVIRMTIPFYTETVAHKAAEVLHGRHDTTAANGSIEARAMRWASTAAITRMAFIAPSTFNFIAGSHVIIYGR
jgi:hypothetical protein